MPKAPAALFFLALLPALFLAAPDLAADPNVRITAPVLEDGLDYFQAELDKMIAGYEGTIADLVSDTLDKPLFMEGFGGAAAQVVLVPSALHITGYPALSLGSAASIYSENLSPALAARLGSLTPESDSRTGMCVQPLVVTASFPLDFLVRGLSLGASGGYMDAKAGDYGVRAYAAGIQAGYNLFKPKKALLAWDGISLGAGADLAFNTLSARIKPGSFEQSTKFDPDGSGPFPGREITISLEPDIDAGITSTMYSLKFRATTGVTLARTLSLCAGGGLTAAMAKAGITVRMDDEFVVSGYLAKLIKEQGRVTISGTASEYETRILEPFVIAGLGFHVGPFEISVPVVWVPNDALGAGAFVGVRF